MHKGSPSPTKDVLDTQAHGYDTPAQFQIARQEEERARFARLLDRYITRRTYREGSEKHREALGSLETFEGVGIQNERQRFFRLLYRHTKK